ncbi:MAG: sce7726 family protein [Xanthomonadales bacterium]|nr:sce7726 family protein [Xanthomonadales bacterium]
MSRHHPRVSELELRQALAAWLLPGLAPDELLVEELGIEHGSTRVDVAKLGRRLDGFEIKSDFDTLDRLARQMHAYHRVFDTLTIVTTPAFVPQVERLLPAWWGILQAARGPNGEISLQRVRPTADHPRQEAESIVSLLWRDEVLTILRNQLGARVSSSANRATLYRQLTELSDLVTIKQWVTSILRTRPSLRDRDLLRVKSAGSGDEPSAPDDGLRHLAATS